MLNLTLYPPSLAEWLHPGCKRQSERAPLSTPQAGDMFSLTLSDFVCSDFDSQAGTSDYPRARRDCPAENEACLGRSSPPWKPRPAAPTTPSPSAPSSSWRSTPTVARPTRRTTLETLIESTSTTRTRSTSASAPGQACRSRPARCRVAPMPPTTWCFRHTERERERERHLDTHTRTRTRTRTHTDTDTHTHTHTHTHTTHTHPALCVLQHRSHSPHLLHADATPLEA